METLWNNLPYLLEGALITVILSAASIAISNFIGILLGVVLFIGPMWIRTILYVYIFIIRGLPELVLMFLCYFGLTFGGFHLSGVAAVGVALVLYSAGFAADITRGALATVKPGQVLAAQSIGLRRAQSLLHVEIPQAFRIAVPALVNNAIITVKATSYASIIGVWELTFASQEVVQRTFVVFPIFAGVMVIYFVICYPLGMLADRLERRFKFQQG